MDIQDTFNRLKYNIHVDTVGNRRYYDSNGELHREGGPALETEAGSTHWYLHGVRHREDGPAVEFVTGKKHWYFHGRHLREEDFNSSKIRDAILKKIEHE